MRFLSNAAADRLSHTQKYVGGGDHTKSSTRVRRRTDRVGTRSRARLSSSWPAPGAIARQRGPPRSTSRGRRRTTRCRSRNQHQQSGSDHGIENRRPVATAVDRCARCERFRSSRTRNPGRAPFLHQIAGRGALSAPFPMWQKKWSVRSPVSQKWRQGGASCEPLLSQDSSFAFVRSTSHDSQE